MRVKVCACWIVVLASVGILAMGHTQASAQSMCTNVPAAASGGVVLGNVVAGQTYVYQASGCARCSPSTTASPDGALYTNDCTMLRYPPSPAASFFTCPGLAGNSLVGKVAGNCIQLGTSGSFVAPASGPLTLYLNEYYYNDNSGSWSVCITPAFCSTGPAAIDSWVSPTRGFWDDYTKWSLGSAPSNAQSVFITNAPTKTVTIDSITAGSYPNSMSIFSLSLLGDSQSTNTLLLDNAGVDFPLQVTCGITVDSNGVLSIVNSALVATNGATYVGYNGSGQMLISNGSVQASVLYLGYLEGSQGALTMARGTLTANSLQGASNAAVSFSAGVIHTGGTSLGAPLTIGDGTDPSTLDLQGGMHSCDSSLTISSNAQLTGYGMVISPVVNNGAILVDGPNYALTFSSSVTNNGTIIVSNGESLVFIGPIINNSIITVEDGASLIFDGPVENNGLIDASSGSVWFAAGAVNNGTILPLAPPAAPSSLEARLFYTDLDHNLLTWQDNAINEIGFVVAVFTNWISGTETNGIFVDGPFTLPADSANWVDPGNGWDVAVPPLQRIYRVRAFNSVGYSDSSNFATTTVWTVTNSWINSGDGAWQDPANWSLTQAPTNIQTLVITNDNSKTVTIDATTSGSYADTMAVSDVVLSAPAGSTNVLQLLNTGTATPLHIYHTLSAGDGGVLQLTTDSTIVVDGLVDGTVNIDGNALLMGGQLLSSSLMPLVIGLDGSGELATGGSLLTTNLISYAFVGGSNGLQGTLSVDGGSYVTPGLLLVGQVAGSTGAVSVTSGKLAVTNLFLTLVGGDGVGKLSLSAGTNVFGPIKLAGNPGSQGTLTVAGGVNNVLQELFIGDSPDATGTVWMTGGQFTATNKYWTSTGSNYWPTVVGLWGYGSVTISNGNWLGGTMTVGSASNSHGVVTLTGGSVTLFSKLVLGSCSPLGAVGQIDLNGGTLYVTNALHNAVVDVGGGTLTLTDGLLVVDTLVLTNACGHFQHAGGTLVVGHLNVDPGLSITGDGLPYVWKQAYGFDPLSSSGNNGPDADPDGDGVSNLQEYLDGTDPTNANSALRITSVTQEGDDNRVTWTTVGGKTYLLQGTVEAEGGSSNIFIDLTTVAMPEGGESTTNYLDVGGATNSPPRSYRVEVVPPIGLSGGFCHATSIGFNQIMLAWSDDNTNEDGYKVERASSAGGPWSQVAQLLANTHSYRSYNLFPNTTYYYRVRAYNSQGDSPASNVASASTPALCPMSVVGWGYNYFGEATPPTNLTGVVAIAAGPYHSLALKGDGTVVGWGHNNYADWGQETPPTNLAGVTAIAAGDRHSLALRNDSTVVGWGYNYSGAATPPTNLTGVVAIAAGGNYSLALKHDGLVVGWGDNSGGQATPPTNLTGVVAIAASGNHSLALRSDGTVVGWGDNGYHQGTPATNFTEVVAIAAGAFHSLALKSDGTVVGWGDNYYGEATPPTNLTGAVAIAAGAFHSLALKSDGTIVGWGQNYYSEATPPTNSTGAVAIAAGSSDSLVLTPVPNAPSNLIATAISGSRINLHWTDKSNNEDHFTVERAPSTTGPWSELASANSNVTTYSDSGLACGQTYFYRLRAVNACAGYLYSGTASANTSDADTDCDGVPNDWMTQYFGHATGLASDSSRATDDRDGDGLTNLQEYQAGTDPTNSVSVLRITSILPQGNDVLVTWLVVTNKTYAVQVATNAVDGSYMNGFIDLATVTVPASPAISETNYLDVGALTNGPGRFYRIRLGP